MIYMLRNMQKVNKFFSPIMTPPLEKIAEEKNGNYQSSPKGGGGTPLLVKDQYISGFFFKAFLSHFECASYYWYQHFCRPLVGASRPARLEM